MQMDKDYIERFDVIRRYHQHKLSEDELNSFEIYILENPDIINVLEQEKAIHDAYREHGDLLKEALPEEKGLSWTQGLALAASLVVALFLVLRPSGSGPDYVLQPPVRLETFRGVDGTGIAVNGQPIVQFQIDMGPAELIGSNAFTAELVDASGNILFSESGLQVDADGWLFYALEGQEMTLAGEYEVRVMPDGIPTPLATYAVNFSAP